MQCKSKYHIIYNFWYSPENSKKEAKKLFFWLFFQRFFDHALLVPKGRALIFSQMKDCIVIHNPGKFHQHRICGSKVINFQMFSWQCSSHFGPFLALSWPFLAQIWLEFVENWTRDWIKTMCEQCFKIKCLRTNGTYPKFSVLVHFWAQFTPGKPKIFPKIKIFPETTSLGLSLDTSPNPQINRWILMKIF